MVRTSRLNGALAVLLAGTLPATGQSGARELPSAPSSTLQQQQQAAQAKSAKNEPQKAAPKTNSAESIDPAPSPDDAPKEAPKPSVTPQKPQNPKPDIKINNQEDQGPATTIIVPVEEIPVIFTVTDKHGRFIKNLTKSDISVLDDKRPPETIRSFSSQSDLPLRVGLLIDASNSIRDRFKFEQEAAAEFLSQILRPKGDEAFVIGFDSTPEVTADFTTNPEKLTRGIRMLRPGGGTALYDAVYYACRDKLMKHAEGSPIATRRAVILISDGEDNQSHVTREEAIEMAERAEAIVYTISTNVSGTVSRGDRVLQRIADATGGRAFFPFKIEDVANAFTEIQEELRSQYFISYKPADFQRDGRYRSIQITAKDKRYKVRARQGYYAPRAGTRTTAEVR